MLELRKSKPSPGSMSVKPKDLSNIAARKVQYYNKTRYGNENKSLKRVLFEFCEQMEAEAETDEYENAEVFFQEYVNEDENKNETCTDETLLAKSLNDPNDDPSLANCLPDF
jgi:hypothetical protein